MGWPRIISNPTSAHCIGSSFYFHFLGHWKPQCNAIVCALMYVCTAMLWSNECMIVYPDLPTHHSMFCVLCMATVYTACYWGVGMCCLSSLVLYPERDMLLFVNTQYIHLGLWMDRDKFLFGTFFGWTLPVFLHNTYIVLKVLYTLIVCIVCLVKRDIAQLKHYDEDLPIAIQNRN